MPDIKSHGMYINNRGPYVYDFTIDSVRIESPFLTQPHPDSAWFHIDTQGHFHAFNTGDGASRLPTLEVVGAEDPDYCPTFHYQCILCGERVIPHFFPGGQIQIKTMEGAKRAIITLPRYNQSVAYGDRVSFYTPEMFGIARVEGIRISGNFDGQNVCVDLSCEFVVERGSRDL